MAFMDENPYLEHPSCLAILRRQLDDTAPTGGAYGIHGHQLDYRGANTASGSSLPDYLEDPSVRRETAIELACDRAAQQIGELTYGMPLVHPLRLDHDERLKEMKTLMDRYQGRFREIHRSEGTPSNRLGTRRLIPSSILPPLGKTATTDDLKSGHAVFSLAAAGKLAPLKLPAVATLKAGPAEKAPPKVLIVQAEIDADGQTVYGLIGRNFIRSAKADEVTNISPIEPAAKNK